MIVTTVAVTAELNGIKSLDTEDSRMTQGQKIKPLATTNQ
jgi:hypothetical protein